MAALERVGLALEWEGVDGGPLPPDARIISSERARRAAPPSLPLRRAQLDLMRYASIIESA